MKKLIFICFLFTLGCFNSNAIGDGKTFYNSNKVSRIKIIKNGDILETKTFSNFRIIYKEELLYLDSETKVQFLDKKEIFLEKGKVIIKGSYIINTKICKVNVKKGFISVLNNGSVTVVKIYNGKCNINKIKYKENNTIIINKSFIKQIKFNDFDKKIKEKDIIKVK